MLSGLLFPKPRDDMIRFGSSILRNNALVSSGRVSGEKVVRERKYSKKVSVPQSMMMATVDFVFQRVIASTQQSEEWSILIFGAFLVF